MFLCVYYCVMNSETNSWLHGSWSLRVRLISTFTDTLVLVLQISTCANMCVISTALASKRERCWMLLVLCNRIITSLRITDLCLRSISSDVFRSLIASTWSCWSTVWAEYWFCSDQFCQVTLGWLLLLRNLHLTCIWISIALLSDILNPAHNRSVGISPRLCTYCQGSIRWVGRLTWVMLVSLVSCRLIGVVWSKSTSEWFNSLVRCLSNNVLNALTCLVLDIASLLTILLSLTKGKCLSSVIVFSKHTNSRRTGRFVWLTNAMRLILVTPI